MQISSFLEALSSASFFIKTLLFNKKINKTFGIIFKNNLKQSLIAVCNKVSSSKLYLYDFRMRPLKLVNWSHEFVVALTYLNVKKQYGVPIFSVRSECNGYCRIRDIVVQRVDKGGTVVIFNSKHVCKTKNVLGLKVSKSLCRPWQNFKSPYPYRE